jgi:hypothetical protein
VQVGDDRAQLQADEDEDRRIEDENQHGPHPATEHARAGFERRGRVARGEEAARYRREHAGATEMLRGNVGNVAREQRDEHVEHRIADHVEYADDETAGGEADRDGAERATHQMRTDADP